MAGRALDESLPVDSTGETVRERVSPGERRLELAGVTGVKGDNIPAEIGLTIRSLSWGEGISRGVSAEANVVLSVAGGEREITGIFGRVVSSSSSSAMMVLGGSWEVGVRVRREEEREMEGVSVSWVSTDWVTLSLTNWLASPTPGLSGIVTLTDFRFSSSSTPTIRGDWTISFSPGEGREWTSASESWISWSGFGEGRVACANDFGEEMVGLKILSLFADLGDEVTALSCWISSNFGEGMVTLIGNGIAELRGRTPSSSFGERMGEVGDNTFGLGDGKVSLKGKAFVKPGEERAELRGRTPSSSFEERMGGVGDNTFGLGDGKVALKGEAFVNPGEERVGLRGRTPSSSFGERMGEVGDNTFGPGDGRVALKGDAFVNPGEERVGLKGSAPFGTEGGKAALRACSCSGELATALRGWVSSSSDGEGRVALLGSSMSFGEGIAGLCGGDSPSGSGERIAALEGWDSPFGFGERISTSEGGHSSSIGEETATSRGWLSSSLEISITSRSSSCFSSVGEVTML
jgi:hypothetical protein